MKARKAPNLSKPVAVKAVAPVLSSQITVSGNLVLLSEFFIFIKDEGISFRKKSYPTAAIGWGTFVVVFKTVFGNKFADVLIKFIESKKAEVYFKNADGSEEKIKAGSAGAIVKIMKARGFELKAPKKSKIQK